MNSKVREQRVNKLTAAGRASKAMQGLITPGMAADTPAVRAKMAAKFPQPATMMVVKFDYRVVRILLPPNF